MNKLPIISLILLLVAGCIEDFDLNPGSAVPKMVVEALITNKPGPYLIRLTESHTGKFVEPDFSNIDDAKGIMNAEIIISDDVDQVDPLLEFVAVLGQRGQRGNRVDYVLGT